MLEKFSKGLPLVFFSHTVASQCIDRASLLSDDKPKVICVYHASALTRKRHRGKYKLAAGTSCFLSMSHLFGYYTDDPRFLSYIIVLLHIGTLHRRAG